MLERLKLFWRFVYTFWPPCIRVIERLGFHQFRQKFLLGTLKETVGKDEFRAHLEKHGFEMARIAWKDPGEILSMRKFDNELYQYHIRLFADGEIRAHYEFAPEAHPLKHVWERHFESKMEVYREMLGGLLLEK